MATVTTPHPQYVLRSPQWETMGHAYEGSYRVKQEGVRYLPPTQAMQIDGMGPTDAGRRAYDAYRSRAVYPEYVKEGVEAYLGIMHKKRCTITVPDELLPLLDNATVDGQSVYTLLRNITEEQLRFGRCGLLVDIPVGAKAGELPYIALYDAQSIVNWDGGTEMGGQQRPNMVVLNESGNIRTDVFSWRYRAKYRVLMLGDTMIDEATGQYRQGEFIDDAGAGETETGLEYNESVMTTPSLYGKQIDVIPFVFVNYKSLSSDTDLPPLMGLAESCFVIYRGEADYRQNLFMQGQDTLIVKDGGSSENSNEIRMGAGAYIRLPESGDAKFIGVNSTGLSEQRLAIENDRKAAESRAGALASPTSAQVESGDALEVRLAAQTSTLNQIAITAAAAVEVALKLVARWVGADESKVVVTPNLDFASAQILGQDMNYFMQARAAGLPLSLESIHGMMADRGATKLDYQSEMKLITQENKDNPALVPQPSLPAATNPANNNPQPTPGVTN